MVTLEQVYQASLKSKREFLHFCWMLHPDHNEWTESALNYALKHIELFPGELYENHNGKRKRYSN